MSTIILLFILFAQNALQWCTSVANSLGLWINTLFYYISCISQFFVSGSYCNLVVLILLDCYLCFISVNTSTKTFLLCFQNDAHWHGMQNSFLSQKTPIGLWRTGFVCGYTKKDMLCLIIICIAYFEDYSFLESNYEKRQWPFFAFFTCSFPSHTLRRKTLTNTLIELQCLTVLC